MIKNYTLSGNTDYRICFKDYMSIELFKNTLCDCLLRYFFDNNNFRYNINNVKASYNPILQAFDIYDIKELDLLGRFIKL